jgi:hypothetical protein
MKGAGPGGIPDQDLATALNITVDKLTAAYQTANTEALKQAVSKGLLTQAQADQMALRMGRHPVGGFGRMGMNGIDYNALLANALGITPDQLKAASLQAFNANLDTAVKAGKLTQAQADNMKAQNALAGDAKFQAGLQDAYKAALEQAVTDGVITQAQADQMLQQQSKIGAPGFGPGFFQGFGRGFPRMNSFPGSDGQGTRPNGKGPRFQGQPTPTIPPATE